MMKCWNEVPARRLSFQRLENELRITLTDAGIRPAESRPPFEVPLNCDARYQIKIFPPGTPQPPPQPPQPAPRPNICRPKPGRNAEYFPGGEYIDSVLVKDENPSPDSNCSYQDTIQEESDANHTSDKTPGASDATCNYPDGTKEESANSYNYPDETPGASEATYNYPNATKEESANNYNYPDEITKPSDINFSCNENGDTADNYTDNVVEITLDNGRIDSIAGPLDEGIYIDKPKPNSSYLAPTNARDLNRQSALPNGVPMSAAVPLDEGIYIDKPKPDSPYLAPTNARDLNGQRAGQKGIPMSELQRNSESYVNPAYDSTECKHTCAHGDREGYLTTGARSVPFSDSPLITKLPDDNKTQSYVNPSYKRSASIIREKKVDQMRTQTKCRPLQLPGKQNQTNESHDLGHLNPASPIADDYLTIPSQPPISTTTSKLGAVSTSAPGAASAIGPGTTSATRPGTISTRAPTIVSASKLQSGIRPKKHKATVEKDLKLESVYDEIEDDDDNSAYNSAGYLQPRWYVRSKP